MRSTPFRMIIGVLVILAGVLYAGSTFGLYPMNLFFDGWWTLFIIVPCACSLIQYGPNWGNAVGLLIGLWLLGSQQDWLPEAFSSGRMLLALFIVLIGLSLIFGRKRRRHYENPPHQGGNPVYPPSNSAPGAAQESAGMPYTGPAPVYEGSSNFRYECYFGSANYQNYSPTLTYGSVDTAFGSIRLDLSQAVLQNNVTVKVSSIFGKVEIFAPRGTNIVVNGSPFLGSINNLCRDFRGAYTIIFECEAIFGGIDLK